MRTGTCATSASTALAKGFGESVLSGACTPGD